MNQELLNIAHKIGLDKAIAYSSGARIIQGVAGVASIFFIATFLTGEEQGYFFTFGSILALQVFFELGLTGILIQFTAHEMSHLKINEDNTIYGDMRYVSRLASLIQFCVKWYAAIAILAMIVLSVVGYVYFACFSKNEGSVSWVVPWMLICVSTAIKIFQAPFSSVLMGMGFVKQMNKIIFYQQLIIPITMWIGLILGLKLYVLGIGYLLSVLLWTFMIWRDKSCQILFGLYNYKVTERICYVNEIFPFQWRTAISGFSGYFIFQLFNPVLFATEGAVVAGQMGMTLQALNAISSMSMSWLSTKIPLYSQLIALKDYINLDRIFQKTLRQMVLVCTSLLFLFFCVLLIINFFEIKIGDTYLSSRFLSYVPTFLMAIPVFLQQFTNSWAGYLRCHKKEPFLLNSVVCAILCCISSATLGYSYGLYGITVGYCVISIVLFPWGYWIFRTKKYKWHLSIS